MTTGAALFVAAEPRALWRPVVLYVAVASIVTSGILVPMNALDLEAGSIWIC
ncbi:MAG: hypothetical protein ABI873_02755 [Marmoricola sp.]